MLSFKVNNNRQLNLRQIEQYGNISVYITNDRKIDNYKYTIPAGDFVMLLNYYRHIKGNDIQNDFINSHGANKEV